MSYFMWLLVVKRLASSYSETVKRYNDLSSEEKLRMYEEYSKTN